MKEVNKFTLHTLKHRSRILLETGDTFEQIYACAKHHASKGYFPLTIGSTKIEVYSRKHSKISGNYMGATLKAHGLALKCGLTDVVFLSARKLGEYLTNLGYRGYTRNKMAYIVRTLIRSFPEDRAELTPFNIKLVKIK